MPTLGLLLAFGFQGRPAKVRTDLGRDVFVVGDVNGDEHQDLFVAPIGMPGRTPWVWLDGRSGAILFVETPLLACPFAVGPTVRGQRRGLFTRAFGIDLQLDGAPAHASVLGRVPVARTFVDVDRGLR